MDRWQKKSLGKLFLEEVEPPFIREVLEIPLPPKFKIPK